MKKIYSRVRQATEVNIIWLMRFVRWIKNSTNTHSEYKTLNDFRQQHFLLSDNYNGYVNAF